MADESEGNQITEKAIPIQGISLDGATIRLMLQPRGIVGISSETFKPIRYVAVAIDIGEVENIDSTEGSDGLMDLKDSILRDVDTRLMALLNL